MTQNQRSTTRGSVSSSMRVHEKSRQQVMHPTDLQRLIDALQWAVNEADRLVQKVQDAGLYVDGVEVRMPSATTHSVSVTVSGVESFAHDPLQGGTD